MDANRSFEYRCQSCGASLAVRVPFKGRLEWLIEPGHPDFSIFYPEPIGEYGKVKLSCTADPMHETGFHLIDGEVERNLAASVWD